MATPDLLQLREAIGACDAALLELLARRRALVLDVARSKQVSLRSVRDRAREEALLERLVREGRAEHGLEPSLVTRVFHAIIEDSVLTQQAWFEARARADDGAAQPRVAFLGARGSYSQLAARRFFARRSESIVELGLDRFDAIVEAVLSGVADFGVLPVENSTTGSITEVFDILQRTPMHVVGEATHDIDHALLVGADGPADLGAARRVLGHPQALQQCRRWIERNLPDAEWVYCASTSDAMTRVATAPDGAVAVGSRSGGELHGLAPLAEGIADVRGNQTRFFVVGRQALPVAPQVPARTALMLSTGQAPGALVEALVVLRDHGLSMARLESRPIHGNPWEEMFHIDVDGNVDSAEMQAALEALRGITRTLRVLGCYPVESIAPTPVPRRSVSSPQPQDALAQPEIVLGRPPQQLALRSGGDALIGRLVLDLAERDAFVRAVRDAADGGAAAVLVEPRPGWTGREALREAVVGVLDGARDAGAPLVVWVEEAAAIEALVGHVDALALPVSASSAVRAAAAAALCPVLVCGEAIDGLRRAAAEIGAAGNQQVALVLQGGLELPRIAAATGGAPGGAPVLVALQGAVDPSVRAAVRALGAAGTLVDRATKTDV